MAKTGDTVRFLNSAPSNWAVAEALMGKYVLSSIGH